MKNTLGMILIGLGLIGLAWGGFTYTSRERMVDTGSMYAMHDQTQNVPLLPISGAAALIGGVVLLVAGRKS